jgi:hypothetical protein
MLASQTTKTPEMGEAVSTASRSCHPDATSSPHAFRAWLYLVWFCTTRQSRVRQMVWIALALLALTGTVIGLNTLADGWGMADRRWIWVPIPPVPPGKDAQAQKPSMKGEFKRLTDSKPNYSQMPTFGGTAREMEIMAYGPWPESAAALQKGIARACRELINQSGFYVFSTYVVFSLFVGFLLPIWSLSFSTEAISGEREGRSLIWLLTRPLPRSSVYLAKFVAVLPWSLALNVGGYGLLCLLAGQPGHMAFRMFWPAILGGTLAFCSLFQLMGACFRRAAVIALVYSFFLETIVGGMPGYMKRLSVGFYTRCLMFDAAHGYGVEPEKPSIYLPVDRFTAWGVLLSVTVILLMVGMIIFSRREYHDLA